MSFLADLGHAFALGLAEGIVNGVRDIDRDYGPQRYDNYDSGVIDGHVVERRPSSLRR